MTRKECLDKAAECVLKDRQNVYGKPEDCFGMIAKMWGAYLGVCVSAHDVAAMMALLKIARFRHNPLHEDNAVDCAGYAACMVETATAWEREGEDEDEDVKSADVVELWKHKPKAESGCCQNGNNHPEFKPGDRVQVRMPAAVGDRWVDAVCVSILPEGTGIRVDCGDYKAIAFGWPNIRHAPKSEGCEELVVSPFDEDRMRESMPGIVPQDGPSDMDALLPHRPTGEELAEMAEEEGNA